MLNNNTILAQQKKVIYFANSARVGFLFSATARSASLLFVSNTARDVTEAREGLMIYLKQTSSSNATWPQAISHHLGLGKHWIIVRHNLLGPDQSDLTGLFQVPQLQADT